MMPGGWPCLQVANTENATLPERERLGEMSWKRVGGRCARGRPGALLSSSLFPAPGGLPAHNFLGGREAQEGRMVVTRLR